MSTQLPSTPGIRSAKVHLLDWGALLTPPLGGVNQYVARMGTRFAVDYEMPPLSESTAGRTFIALLRQAKTDGAIMPFPQFGLVIGAPGVPKIKTAVASGNSITITGLTVGYTIKAGQFFSIIHAGRRYLHSATADVVANGTGDAVLTIHPILRVPLAVNDVVEIAVPMIEGLLSGVDWDVMQVPFNATTFTITEAE